LVIVAQNGESIEYRTLPDSQVKVVEYLATTDESYFEAFLPSGWIVVLRDKRWKSTACKVMDIRALGSQRRRGTLAATMTYGYCLRRK
jgi:hypothetical protein